MFIAALLGSVHIPLDPDRLLADRFLIHTEELHRLFCHADDLFILNKIYLSGIPKHRRHIRGNDAAPVRMPYDQRTVLAYRIEFLRMILEDDPQGIRPLHTVHDLGDRLQRIPLIIIIQKMGNDLRIRLGHKLIPVLLKLFL